MGGPGAPSTCHNLRPRFISWPPLVSGSLTQSKGNTLSLIFIGQAFNSVFVLGLQNAITQVAESGCTAGENTSLSRHPMAWFILLLPFTVPPGVHRKDTDQRPQLASDGVLLGLMQ